MHALRIQRRLESDTIPELKALIGRKVEIIVIEEADSFEVEPTISFTATRPLKTPINGAHRPKLEPVASSSIENYEFDTVEDEEA